MATLLPELAEEDRPSGSDAVLAMAHEILRHEKETVVLIGIGPMTNIALLLRRFPKVREWLRRIVIMGGARFYGNVSRFSEFNI